MSYRSLLKFSKNLAPLILLVPTNYLIVVDNKPEQRVDISVLNKYRDVKILTKYREENSFLTTLKNKFLEINSINNILDAVHNLTKIKDPETTKRYLEAIAETMADEKTPITVELINDMVDVLATHFNENPEYYQRYHYESPSENAVNNFYSNIISKTLAHIRCKTNKYRDSVPAEIYYDKLEIICQTKYHTVLKDRINTLTRCSEFSCLNEEDKVLCYNIFSKYGLI